MSFNPVAVYTLEGEFVAYAIMGPHKLQSLNLYREGEEESLNGQLARLNTSVSLKDHWPHPQDPEVVAILDDPSFMPLSYVEQEVVDDDKSFYVWKLDSDGNQTEDLDEEASVIRYKTAKVPERPTDVMVRIKAACEQVATRRAGLAT